MNLGVICDVSSNKPVCAIAVDKETGTVAYATGIEELDKVIDVILNVDALDLVIPEEIGGKKIQRIEKIDTRNSQYLMALNYSLPFPWRIMALRYVEGDIEKIVEECYYCMEVPDEKIGEES